jgi:hypothetical protein
MTARIAWMRPRARGARHAKRAPPVQVRASSAGSELSRQVPVDLEPDADLKEGRGAPGHWSCSLAFQSGDKLDRGTPPRKPPAPHGRTLTQQGNSIAGRPVGLPVTTPAAYHCEGKPIRCLTAAAMSLR